MPEIAVFVTRGDARASGTTDGQGWFETDVPGVGSGAFTVELSDLGVALASFTRDPAKEPPPWILQVEIGPTYPLVFHDKVRTATRARVVESAREEDVAGVLAVLPGEITLAEEDSADDRTWSWQPARPGERPWIRYPSMEHEPDDRSKKRIEAEDDAGRFFRGATWGTVGVQREVGLRFVEARMRVAGHVVEGRDRPLAGATVFLAPERVASSETGRATSVWLESRSGPDGSFAFEGVPRQEWNVFAWTTDARSSFDHARVPVDERAHVMLLRPRSTGGGFVDVADVFPSQGIRTLPDLEKMVLVVHIEECAPFGHEWLLPLGGERRPPPLPGVTSISRAVWLGEPVWSSATGAFFEEALQRERWRLDVVDGTTGAPVDGAEVLLGPAGAILTRKSGASSWLFPQEIEVEWMVAHAGHTSVFGDEHSFHMEDDGRVARATLWPGWGAALYFRAGPRLETEDGSTLTTDVLGALGAPPIPGVEVLADGLEAGTSDARGAVRLGADLMPLRLTLVRRHWRLTGLDRLTVPGSCALRYVVWLEPDPR